MGTKLLKDLYDCFYTPPSLFSERHEVEKCHQALINALEKPERRLVLRIIAAVFTACLVLCAAVWQQAKKTPAPNQSNRCKRPP